MFNVFCLSYSFIFFHMFHNFILAFHLASLFQLTDRHPLSNCPQLLIPTHPPVLVLMIIYVVGYLLLSLSLAQDPVESSSCLDFYQLVLFYATTGDGAGVTVDHGGDTVGNGDYDGDGVDFYQLVLFYATTGAAVLGAVGVALLIFVKAVKRNEKEERKVKAGSK